MGDAVGGLTTTGMPDDRSSVSCAWMGSWKVAGVRLYKWQPDRDPRMARIQSPPTDGQGLVVDVFDGAAVPQGKRLAFKLGRPGQLPDFLYDVGLLLIVSEHALELIMAARAPGIEVHPASILDARGTKVAEYYWLNTTLMVSLLDRAASRFRLSPQGVFRGIEFFSIAGERIPESDLFICDEGQMRVFSGGLAENISSHRLTGAVFSPLQGSRWP